MPKKLLIFAAFIFSTLNTFAQIYPPADVPVLKDSTNFSPPDDYTIGEIRGNVNSKAVFLAKPVYPAEAGQKGAEGAVRVKITIDAEGNVVAANAFDGHQLLRTAAEDAARKSKFRIARDAGGNAVKVEGSLTYNFSFPKANWSRIGYDLSLLEKLPGINFQPAAARKAFAPEWFSELEMLDKIAEIKSNQSPTQNLPFVKSTNTSVSSNGKTSAALVGVVRFNVPASPTADQIALSQNLVSALRARLGDDERSLWQFNLGISLTEAFKTYRNPDEHANAALIVRQYAENAPAGISTETISALQNLAAIFEKPNRSPDSFKEMNRSVTVILNAK